MKRELPWDFLIQASKEMKQELEFELEKEKKHLKQISKERHWYHLSEIIPDLVLNINNLNQEITRYEKKNLEYERARASFETS